MGAWKDGMFIAGQAKRNTDILECWAGRNHSHTSTPPQMEKKVQIVRQGSQPFTWFPASPATHPLLPPGFQPHQPEWVQQDPQNSHLPGTSECDLR